jgi:hypothetical protein
VRDTYVLPIDEELVRRLQITEEDWVIQEETENGILITFSERSRITDTSDMISNSHHQ